MQKLRAWLKAAAEAVFLLLAAPWLLLGAMAGLAFSDLLAGMRGKPGLAADRPVARDAVSIVIPTWNGRHHLEQNLPSVVAAVQSNPRHEILVVDNGSSDGSVELVKRHFPSVRLLELERNLGFGGGSNAGIRAARHDIVVLLNNDMRVEPGFIEPLLEGFSDPRIFAVSAQIFFSDPAKRREETGLTYGEWVNGRLSVTQLVDDQVGGLFPVFYAGGGSTAYDRRKFLELGGFDALMEPFYLEDTDLSYMAWKRGWIILYQPDSVVYHEHRGTIGKHFSSGYIESVLKKNHLLFTWKNIHEWGRLAAHFFWVYGGLWMHLLAGATPTRPTPTGLLRALRQFRQAAESRRRARSLAAIDDTEAFRRPLGGYFRDRFMEVDPSREKLNVLFVSPYSMEPPLHGGAVFMNQTVRSLSERARVHLICLLDEPEEYETNRRLESVCASAEFMIRWTDYSRGIGALEPHAARTFYSVDLLWKIHRCIYQRQIDIVQLDYTQLATYAPAFLRVATFLFEHDIHFQSVMRGMKALHQPAPWMQSGFEYLRALRFERRALGKFDGVQVCTAENRRYLESFSWNGTPIREGLRAGIDVRRYPFVETGREPDTVLFVGNFRHEPNRGALEFFVHRVFPAVRRARPKVRLMVAGAQAPAGFEASLQRPGVVFLGEIRDIREVFARYAAFVCPILSGSGVRVKLLEAFASGIPAVSTPIGAEGLTTGGGDHLEVAEPAEQFAGRLLALLEDPERARAMAARARRRVEAEWDMECVTGRLENYYRRTLQGKARKNAALCPEPFQFPRAEVESTTAATERPA